MQHVEDQSAAAAPAVKGAATASSTPVLPRGEATTAAAAAPALPAGSTSAATCGQPQDGSKEESAAEASSQVGPSDPAVALGAPSAASGERESTNESATARERAEEQKAAAEERAAEEERGGAEERAATEEREAPEERAVTEARAGTDPSPEAGSDCHTATPTNDAAALTQGKQDDAAAPPSCSEEAMGTANEAEEKEHHVPSEANQTIPRLMGRQTWRPRGQRLSFGRLCKGSAAPGGCTGDRTAAKKRWEQLQQQKEKNREARATEKQVRAVKEKVRLQRRKQREAKKQRKKENEMKSAKVQVIKDTTKIRKWSKQARRQLVKMSPEMIRQLYGVQL